MDWMVIGRARLQKAEEAVREAERELGSYGPEAKARYVHCLRELERAKRFLARPPPDGAWDGHREGLFG